MKGKAFYPLLRLIKNESMACIAGIFALASMFFVPPDGEYPSYIDLKVLCLLFCLMAVVQGLRQCRAFELLSAKLTAACADTRSLAAVFVALPFFLSMLVTNDVALITFVPLTLMTLKAAKREELAAPLVVMQTIAANLGSMATPVGNPQNLYLYSFFELSAGEFFTAVLPIAGVGLLLLAAAVLFLKSKPVSTEKTGETSLENPLLLAVSCGLFILCLCTIFGALNYLVLTAVVIIAALVFSRGAMLRVDYGLLLTFVFFFVFSGNIGRIEQLRLLLESCLAQSAFLTSAAASQVISNVPAAVLLSGFTDSWKQLLLGVDVGGLGTPVASLASLISIKYFFREYPGQKSRFLWLFTAANLVGLAVLIPLSMLLLK